MLTLSLVFAFLLDRLVPDLRNLRDRKPLDHYYQWLLARVPLGDSEPWVVPLLLILPLVLVFALLESLVDAALWDLFALGFYTALAFLCIDSSLILEAVDADIEDKRLSSDATDNQAAVLLSDANTAYYSVVFWMLIGGPVILVFYRLVQKLPAAEGLPQREQWQAYINTMVGWLEWLPSLLSSFAYMACGNFDAGLKRFRQLDILGEDMAQLNQTRLREVGMACVNASDSKEDAVEMLKRSRGLALRALMLWILVAALLEVLF